MKIAIFTSFFAPAFLGGGPVQTLTAMLENSPQEFESAVITSNKDMGRDEALDVVSDRWVPYNSSIVYYAQPNVLWSLLRAMRATRAWRPDAIYVNSFFDPRFSILPQLIFRFGILRPEIFVIAPRGEFNIGALQIRPAKKMRFIRFFKLAGLARKVVWHASSAVEAEEIRLLFGIRSKVIIRENDTRLPSSASDLRADNTVGALRVVSLSRLAPKKGVDTLLEGLGAVSDSIVLDVIGPAEDEEYARRCHRLAEQLPSNIDVNFLGPVPHGVIREKLSAYDVMACPTKGENFGHVIAEALSVSCPVICADVTPWTARLAEGGGVVLEENSPSGWGNAISSYAKLSRDEVAERRRSAGAAYDKWTASSSGEHFFDLLKRAVPASQK